MMRTIEVLLVIIIITAAFLIAHFFAVLPTPRQVSPISLRRLALTTLQTLDVDYALSETVFRSTNDLAWGQLQIALSACLPPNIVYNFTVYEVLDEGSQLYTPIKTFTNARDLGISSDASSYLTASSNVTFGFVPEKIGEHGGGGTLYILNCSDANGWWITGYTGQKLAEDLYRLLSPYFQATVMVQNTAQLGQILNGTTLTGEVLQNAVVINTFGETVPMPDGYYASTGIGYDAARSSYALYCYTLGQKVRQHNWTWASIVGYPLYYVSNTIRFTGSGDHNGWGIFGMKNVGAAGLNVFLRGLNNQAYAYDSTWLTGSPGLVYLSPSSQQYSNYYGIYPSTYQTSSRALPTSITSTYNLVVTTYVFSTAGGWNPGAVYRHFSTGSSNSTGALFALGLARTPDVRLTALGLLCDYKPRLYRSDFTTAGTSRLVILQLGQAGGV